MAKGEVINIHTIRHIWEQYAKKLLIENSHYMGVAHNKIKNYYIYNKNIAPEPRKVQVNYKSTITNGKVTKRLWKASVYGSAGLVHSYEHFKNIVITFLNLAKKEILDANAVRIPHLGRLCAYRKERDFRVPLSKRMVNWYETNKQPKVWDEEKQKMTAPRLIYHADDDWCRIGWFKVSMHNIGIYQFRPAKANSKGVGGFKSEFSKELTKNPLLQYRFLYVPIKVIQYEEAS